MARSWIALLLPLLLLAASTVRAQAPSQSKPFQISVDVELVELHVAVTDKDGRVIPDLTQEHFQVFEDKVKQDITLFKHEDIPLSMGLIIDNSGSMTPRMEKAHSAALTFVRESNPDDETFVIAFDDEAYLQQDFTSSMGDLVDAFDTMVPRLQTALWDAIYLGVNHVKGGHLDKKALLIISDGEDSSSILKGGYEALLKHVRSNAKDVTIFAVGLLEEDDQRPGGLFGRNRPSKKAKAALEEIAALTGGQAFFPKSVDEVEEICRRIARDLRNQYTVGYRPKNTARDGTWREVKVEVNPPRNSPKAQTRTKLGYFAPGPTQ